MICRRASEIDVAEFLADAQDHDLAAFRAHYPQCPDCAAEVRGWIEVHAQLQAAADEDDAHPAAELLLQFEQAPGTLTEQDHRSVQRHLADCASCRDELNTLRSFDFGQLRPVAPPRESWRRLPGHVAWWLRRLVLHPAFAYALVLLLLASTMRQRLGPGFVPPAEDFRAPRAQMNEEEGQPARPGVRREMKAAASESAARTKPQAVGGEQRAGEAEAPVAQAAAPRRKDEAAKEAASTYRRGEAAGVPPAAPSEADTARYATLRDKLAKVPSGSSSQLAARGQVAAPHSVLHLDPANPVAITASEIGRGLTLYVPVPKEDVPGGEIEVRVLSPDGSREMRQRFAPPAHTGYVEMPLPAAWLAEGAYRVDVQSATIPRRVSSFSFRIR